MGEDEDAGRAGGVDEPGGRDRLARCGRVFEPVAPPGAGVVLFGNGGLHLVNRGDVGDGDIESGLRRTVIPVAVAVRAVAVAISVGLVVLVVVVDLRFAALAVADQRGQLAGQRVHLVAAQRGARCEPGRLARQDAVEAEDQREVAAPLVAGLDQAPVHLGDRRVQRGSARGAGCERRFGVLALMQERLSAPRSYASRGRYKIGRDPQSHAVGAIRVIRAPERRLRKATISVAARRPPVGAGPRAARARRQAPRRRCRQRVPAG